MFNLHLLTFVSLFFKIYTNTTILLYISDLYMNYNKNHCLISIKFIPKKLKKKKKMSLKRIFEKQSERTQSTNEKE